MLPSEILRKAAAIMADGFSLDYSVGKCGCFLERLSAAAAGESINGSDAYLGPIIGHAYMPNGLSANGWRDGDTDDAVAALNIAADIAECEGQ